MPKPMYVWSGSAWVSVATEVESLATYATQSYADNQPGMKMIVPSSVAVGSGTGSVSTQGTVTFSGASSVSLNGVFNSTYDNYKILFKGTGSVAETVFNARMRLVTTDASGANYAFQRQENNNTSISGARTTAATSCRVGSINTAFSTVELTVFNPFIAAFTNFQSHNMFARDTVRMELFTGVHGLSTSYDGISFNTGGADTITGTIQVYGYKAG